eukprot:6209829-Pleurochrysis_carterae.AAC.1
MKVRMRFVDVWTLAFASVIYPAIRPLSPIPSASSLRAWFRSLGEEKRIKCLLVFAARYDCIDDRFCDALASMVANAVTQLAAVKHLDLAVEPLPSQAFAESVVEWLFLVKQLYALSSDDRGPWGVLRKTISDDKQQLEQEKQIKTERAFRHAPIIACLGAEARHRRATGDGQLLTSIRVYAEEKARMKAKAAGGMRVRKNDLHD